MAEIFLIVALSKLAEITIKIYPICEVNKTTVKFLPQSKIAEEVENLNKEVENLMGELSWSQIFIKDANKRCIVDETEKKWVMDLTEIAYQIEDAVDVFFLECPTTFRRFQVLPMISSKLSFLNKFQNEMESFRKEISRINKSRMKSEVKNPGEEAQSDSGLKQDPIWNPEVVGFAEDAVNVAKNLCDVNNKSLAVVSIVGPAGIGKTTLARKVFYSVVLRKEFDESAWVTVSRNYNFLHVLRMIANCFNIDSTGLDANELAYEIREHLNRKKYIIVLDDIWTNELCNELLIKVLPDTKNGSRVLITTRLSVDVARNADTSYEPYQLKFLNYEQSRDLFLKNAIPKNHQHLESISELDTLTNKFINKCMGLPLALIHLGRLLSKRECNYDQWKKILNSMSWWDDEIEFRLFSRVIASSFENLPFARKFCFMYFAAFPENQEIEAQPLLRMWIAEGFIPLDDRSTLEQTAECFLEDLVQRSMVQVSKRNTDGSINYLRVDNIMRELAIEKAKENKFLVVFSNKDDCMLPHFREARRLAVHYSDFNESELKYIVNRNLRTLLIFGKSKLDYSKYKLLRVLAHMDMNDAVELHSFTEFPHLRYLQLSCKVTPSIKKSYDRDFGKSIKAMKSLETLDLRSASHGDLTHWLWKIETLRHVQLSYFSPMSTQGPPASANLPNLQTLTGVIPNITWKKSKLPNIPQMRELDIQLDIPYQLDVIAALLCELNNLVYLSVCGNVIQKQNFGRVLALFEKLKHNKIATKKGSTLELKDNTRLTIHTKNITNRSYPLEKSLDNIQMIQECKTEPGALLEGLNVSRCDNC